MQQPNPNSLQQNSNFNMQQNPNFSPNEQQCPTNSCYQQTPIQNMKYQQQISSMPPNYSNQYYQQQFQNQNMQKQTSNSNFQQQYSNYKYQNESMPSNFSNQCFQQTSIPDDQQYLINNDYQQDASIPISSMPQHSSSHNFRQNPSYPISSMPPHFQNQYSQQQTSNPDLQQQSSNQNFQQSPQCPISSMPQHFSNQNIQQNSSIPNESMPQHFPNQNFQQKRANPISSMPPHFRNQNFQQQTSNQNYQQNHDYPISSMPRHFPSQNYQNQSGCPISSMTKHYQNRNIPLPQNPTFTPQTEAERPYHGFQIVYDNFTFVVDPYSLIKASYKFKELIGPYVNNYTQMKEIHLLVHGNQFTKRNMNNFLRICQQLPTDVQNSEMKEICEIAKMFQSDEIYNKGLAFIQANEDPNFNVPDSKYDGSDGNTYITVESESNLINNDSDIEDSYFEDADDQTYDGNYYKINNNNNDGNNTNNNEDNDLNNNQGSNLNISNNQSGEVNISNNQIETSNENADENDEKQENQPKKKHSVVYQVRFESHTFKCPTFKFVQDNTILFTAKQKFNKIYIAKGAEVHIRNKASHVCLINQNETAKINKVRIGERVFEVKYVGTGSVNLCSIEATFVNNDQTLSWIPKPPRFNPTTGKYYLNFRGEYHHTPIPSTKNTILQNRNHKTTFIVRKMDSNVYEIECLPAVEPLNAFTIGLSEIIGPYLDPWAANGTEHL